MVNQEILGGLKSALERGYSLEKAMLTLFNAGYKRQDIEEAAISLYEYGSTQPAQPAAVPTLPAKPSAAQPQKAETKPVSQVSKPVQRPVQTQQPAQLQKAIPASMQPKLSLPSQISQQPFSGFQKQMELQQSVQRVSQYGGAAKQMPRKEKVGGRGVIIILVVLLIFLVGALGAILIFRQQLIDFLNGVFG